MAKNKKNAVVFFFIIVCFQFVYLQLAAGDHDRWRCKVVKKKKYGQ